MPVAPVFKVIPFHRCGGIVFCQIPHIHSIRLLFIGEGLSIIPANLFKQLYLIRDRHCHHIGFFTLTAIRVFYCFGAFLIIHKALRKPLVIRSFQPDPVGAEIQRIEHGFDQIAVCKLSFCHIVDFAKNRIQFPEAFLHLSDVFPVISRHAGRDGSSFKCQTNRRPVMICPAGCNAQDAHNNQDKRQTQRGNHGSDSCPDLLIGTHCDGSFGNHCSSCWFHGFSSIPSQTGSLSASSLQWDTLSSRRLTSKPASRYPVVMVSR